jgi:hypothetical protein
MNVLSGASKTGLHPKLAVTLMAATNIAGRAGIV